MAAEARRFFAGVWVWLRPDEAAGSRHVRLLLMRVSQIGAKDAVHFVLGQEVEGPPR